MKVLITGGHGRVGKYILEELRRDHELTVFDIKGQDPGKNYRSIKGDLCNPRDLLHAAEGVDGVIHLAGIPTDRSDIDRVDDIMNMNVMGTFHLLEACAKNKVNKIIFASSICAGGYIFWKKPFTPEYFPVDEVLPSKPDDIYGLSKLLGEKMGYAYSQRYGISVICLRLASVLFPEVFERTQAIVRRHTDPALGKDLLWNYVDVRDVAAAVRLSLEKNDASFEIYNIGAADVLSNEKSIDLIIQYYPDVKAIKNEDAFLLRKNAALFGIAKAQRELGYSPKFSWHEYLHQKPF